MLITKQSTNIIVKILDKWPQDKSGHSIIFQHWSMSPKIIVTPSPVKLSCSTRCNGQLFYSYFKLLKEKIACFFLWYGLQDVTGIPYISFHRWTMLIQCFCDTIIAFHFLVSLEKVIILLKGEKCIYMEICHHNFHHNSCRKTVQRG